MYYQNFKKYKGFKNYENKKSNIKNFIFTENLMSIYQNNVLKKIIKNLIDNNNYLNDYASYLIGTYDDEEFKEISKKYVKIYDDATIKDIDIYYTINLLKDILNNKVKIEDIISILNVSPIRLQQFEQKYLSK